MQSMTAFARVQRQIGHTLIVWEIRSVNHRYLDTAWRLPDSMRQLESPLREKVRKHLGRGKIECQLKITRPSGKQAALVLDKARARAILEAAEALHREFDLTEDMSVNHLLQLPDVLVEETPDYDVLEDDIVESFQEALEQLNTLRAQEGQAIVKMLQARIEAIGTQLEALQSISKKMNAQLRSRLTDRLDAFAFEVDNQRIAQEIALLLVRMDVTEELDRIKAHCDQVVRLFSSKQPVGRKLDFLMQELNREANTLGSKSDDVHLTRAAVEIKVMTEQMREQIQNIE